MAKFGIMLFLLSFGLTMHGVVGGFSSSILGDKAKNNGWSEIGERGVAISFDLQTNPLQIRTNATAGSGDEMSVQFRTKRGKAAGGIKIQFSDPPAYKISYCSWDTWTYFTMPHGDQGTRIWTIIEADNTLFITCNDIAILDYTFTQSNNSKCVPNWAKDAQRIKFVSGDTASQVYRVKPADYKDWELEAGLLINEMEQRGTEGLVIVGLRNRVTGEEKIGTVCDDRIDEHAADLACQLMGYDYCSGYGNHGDVGYQYYPELQEEGVANTTEILVDGMNCTEEAESYRECHYNFFDHDCTHYEDLVLSCATDPTPSPTFPTTTWNFPTTPIPTTIPGPTDWTSVRRREWIQYNLDAYPIQIKTDSSTTSSDEYDQIILILATADFEDIRAIFVEFSDEPLYYISGCTDSGTPFPVDLPEEQDKIWTITKYGTSIKIECNDVEVLHYVFSEADTPDDCVDQYSNDARRIGFDERDTASDEYRQKPTDELPSSSPSLPPFTPPSTTRNFPTSSVSPSRPLDDEAAGKLGASGSRLQINPKKGRVKLFGR